MDTIHRYFYQHAREGAVVTDDKFVIESLNPAAEKIFQTDEKKLRGQPIGDAIHFRFVDHSHSDLFEQLAVSGSWRGRISYHLPDGSILLLAGNFMAIEPQERDAPRRYLFLFDITLDSETVTTSLLLQQEQYASFLESLSEGVTVQNETAGIILCNPAAERMLGLTKEQILGRSSIDPRWQCIHPDGSPFPGDTHPATTTLRTGVPQHNVVMGVYKPDGAITWISINAIPIFDDPQLGKPTAVIASFSDITEMRRVQEAERRNAQRFQAVFNSMYQFIGIVDPEGTVLDANAGALEFAGVDYGDVVGRPLWESPWMSYSGQIMESIKKDVEAAARGQFIRRELLIAGQGEARTTVDFSLKPIFDEDGRVSMLIPEGRDIGDLKKTEQLLKEANESLRNRAEALSVSNAELERFAYIASHDLQEPLRTVTMFLELLERRYASQMDDTGRRYIATVTRAAHRMKALINDLLHYARTGNEKTGVGEVDANTVVATIGESFQKAIRESGARLTVGKLPSFSASESMMQMLFQNLIGNALKYRSDRMPVIEIGHRELEQHHEFYVKDNGIGIDGQYFEKIFVIFQRLHKKNEYSGTGLGLALCKKIVERHGGSFRVESELDEGSTFYFTLLKELKELM